MDADRLSKVYREKMIDLSGRRLLVSRLEGSDQEQDLSSPTNAGGCGRIRHFRRGTLARWVPNPLPIDPARHRLGLPPGDQVEAQVFQNAACNWRCWYCFVPFNLLKASPDHSRWVSPKELVDAYAALADRPPVLDLSGGQPDLTPEWVPWTMDALDEAGLSDSTYLWSDDNLSNDYFWQYLTAEQRSRMLRHANYGRVGCFKGVDDVSFAFNTDAPRDHYPRQFELFGRLLREGFDVYAYVTLTHPYTHGIADHVRQFVDRLQGVDPMLPLRTVPLEVAPFSPVGARMNPQRAHAVDIGQHEALAAWTEELAARFSSEDRSLPIQEVPWSSRR